MNRLFSAVLCFVFFFSCSDDEAPERCQTKQKADLVTTSLVIRQHDDHHFTVRAEVANAATGECTNSSVPSLINLKISYSVDGNFESNGIIVHDLTLPLPALEPAGKSSIFDNFNLYESGFYSAAWKMDTGNLVDEEDETNNEVKKSFSKQQ